MAGEYEKVKLLGSGSYGKAWLANCRSKKRQVVLKEIKLDCMSDKEIQQALVEVKVLAKCRHVNIISYCEAFERACCLHIVMEFAENGDLQKRLMEQRGIHFSNETILDWFIQICFALKYLHSENILHRDLKPQNLFLTSDGTVKVGDFGISHILQETGDHAVTAIGTPYYLSPEICQRKPYDSKSDMWSAGCVLYELCCLRVPFQAPNLPLLVLAILQGCYDPIPSHCGAVLEDLVSVLLRIEPLQRPSAQQVLNVPALQPHVAATYRRCLKHKQQRQQRQRLSSREPGSPGLFTPKEVDKSPSCHKTFRVKSPLVRRLSVATPKLKATVKRNRSVQSAEPIHTRKRCKQNSSKAPVFNLQKAFLGLRPTRPSCPDLSSSDTQNKETGSVGGMDSDTGPERNDSSYFDDVFDDIASVPTKDGPSDGSFMYPRNSSQDMEDSSQKQYCGSDCDGKIDNGSSVICSPAICKNPEGDNVAPAAIPEVSLNHEVRADDKLLSTFSKSSCTTVEKQSGADMFKIPEVSVVKKLGGTASIQQCYPSRRLTSNTCTVVSKVKTEGTPFCPTCKNGKQPQHCLHQALFQATALSYRSKAAAQRCLSQCLLAHLGSELSLRLCSLVNLALHAGEDYATLETHLDEECKSYLPVIFHLLTWSGEVTTKK